LIAKIGFLYLIIQKQMKINILIAFAVSNLAFSQNSGIDAMLRKIETQKKQTARYEILVNFFFFAVIALLIVFEFLNLLLHPFIGNITHHSPILMLLAMVSIAAILVPLHHKIEHCETKKLIEKNKQIRLVNAKKTIEQLEEKS